MPSGTYALGCSGAAAGRRLLPAGPFLTLKGAFGAKSGRQGVAASGPPTPKAGATVGASNLLQKRAAGGSGRAQPAIFRRNLRQNGVRGASERQGVARAPAGRRNCSISGPRFRRKPPLNAGGLLDSGGAFSDVSVACFRGVPGGNGVRELTNCAYRRGPALPPVATPCRPLAP